MSNIQVLVMHDGQWITVNSSLLSAPVYKPHPQIKKKRKKKKNVLYKSHCFISRKDHTHDYSKMSKPAP